MIREKRSEESMTRTQKRKEELGILPTLFKCFFNDEIVLGHPLNFKGLLFGISHEFTVVSQDSRQDLLSVPCVASVILAPIFCAICSEDMDLSTQKTMASPGPKRTTLPSLHLFFTMS